MEKKKKKLSHSGFEFKVQSPNYNKDKMFRRLQQTDF